jgi:Ca2+-binding EF-hand superfamily protein
MTSRSPQRRAQTKQYERPGLSSDEIEEIREAFNLFDSDGSGLFRMGWLKRVTWERYALTEHNS